jgi:hypothetical protein
MVWPLPAYVLITKSVADVLGELNVKSYSLESMLSPRKQRFSMDFGYSAGALSQFLPEDLAIQYGRPLRLECEPGCWPAKESSEPKAETSLEDLKAKWRRMAEGARCGTPETEEAVDKQSEVAALAGIAGGDREAQYQAADHMPTLLQR